MMVTGISTEGGGVDYLLIGAWSGANEQALLRWKAQTPELHDFPMPDYHRLQLEYWLWKAHQDGRITGRIMDIGVADRRDYMGAGYFTFGEAACDLTGDLTLLYPSDVGGLLDTIICTEVLEHCADPFMACRHMADCLKPGGRLFVTSPFFWPHHGTRDYRDYWRFTHEGWEVLLREVAGLREVTITACEWTNEGASAYDQLRRWEAFGFRDLTHAATGYLCEGVKGD